MTDTAPQRDAVSDETADLSVLDALVAVAVQRGVHLSVPQLCHDYVFGPEGPSDGLILRMAAENGLVARQVTLAWNDLATLGKALPVIIRLNNGHSVVAVSYNEDIEPHTLIVSDPAGGDERLMAVDEARLMDAWDGTAFLVKRRFKPLDQEQPFGLQWVLAQALRERKLFRDVAVATLIMTIFALVPPVVFLIILDRILVSQSGTSGPPGRSSNTSRPSHAVSTPPLARWPVRLLRPACFPSAGAICWIATRPIIPA